MNLFIFKTDFEFVSEKKTVNKYIFLLDIFGAMKYNKNLIVLILKILSHY